MLPNLLKPLELHNNWNFLQLHRTLTIKQLKFGIDSIVTDVSSEFLLVDQVLLSGRLCKSITNYFNNYMNQIFYQEKFNTVSINPTRFCLSPFYDLSFIYLFLY
ncbi:hypothetical protein BpHYR1_037648 [Brachionus plicatilis]|uniref:Uncharacterized protein n=1 Tax=Brachionus plicatilis TaxID=10195 RepID=A0A3M7RKU0_BRAPC|nr:hypothetical protein BpHYR1_037648 [Brachionus plicatilis]